MIAPNVSIDTGLKETILKNWQKKKQIPYNIDVKNAVRLSKADKTLTGPEKDTRAIYH
jgi:hypothetical protein